ncbi:hypothetical protein FF36_04763 [Frankia torreyi]|uniref:Transposase n=1 Tax=Frankia torreyi TaxID=1856 RepID=A0A0D8BBY6_9ACTN|nr:hypothetical protein FF36_04763 [Frankia torreyi]KQM07791.1 hypothetical protein FF86_100147 [Frankia sp. CpI1-P]
MEPRTGPGGSNHDKYLRLILDLGVKPLIARPAPRTAPGSVPNAGWRSSFAHLHGFRRLHIRWEIRDDIHETFLTLGCALICRRRLKASR